MFTGKKLNRLELVYFKKNKIIFYNAGKMENRFSMAKTFQAVWEWCFLVGGKTVAGGGRIGRRGGTGMSWKREF